MRKAILLTVGLVLCLPAVPAAADEWWGKGIYFNSDGNCEAALRRLRREALRSGDEYEIMRTQAAYCTREGGVANYIKFPF
jgi:hypothetical protein